MSLYSSSASRAAALSSLAASYASLATSSAFLAAKRTSSSFSISASMTSLYSLIISANSSTIYSAASCGSPGNLAVRASQYWSCNLSKCPLTKLLYSSGSTFLLSSKKSLLAKCAATVLAISSSGNSLVQTPCDSSVAAHTRPVSGSHLTYCSPVPFPHYSPLWAYLQILVSTPSLYGEHVYPVAHSDVLSHTSQSWRRSDIAELTLRALA